MNLQTLNLEVGSTSETVVVNAETPLSRPRARFLEVLRTDPNNIGAMGNLGVAYSRSSQTAKAIALTTVL